MSFQLVKRLGFNGYPLFQQIENHLTDGVDLIGVGMGQHLLTSLLISERFVRRDVAVVAIAASSFASAV